MLIYEIFFMRKRVLNVKHSEINSFWRMTKPPADHFSYQFLLKSRIFNVQLKLQVFSPFRLWIQGPKDFSPPLRQQGTLVTQTDGKILFEWYCPIYGLVVWALRLFWKVFDWDIFDEITSNIGVITLVAFLLRTAAAPKTHLVSHYSIKRNIDNKYDPTITSYSLPPTRRPTRKSADH